MKFEIKNRFTGGVQYSCEPEAKFAGKTYSVQLGAAVKAAYRSGADLRGANLSYANLSGANLSGADLRHADLRCADLGDADLRGVDLRYTDLRYADLKGANLKGANLEPIRVDFFDVLLRVSSNGEVPGLIKALKEGRVDGSTYEGDCACLVGTIANVKHCKYNAVPNLVPNLSRPVEQFFCNISKGDTPETNSCSELAVEWAEEFQTLMALVHQAGKSAQSGGPR